MTTQRTRDERNIPITMGLLITLVGGVATLVVMLLNLQDRFVSGPVLDSKLSAVRSELTADFTTKIERLRSDLIVEIHRSQAKGNAGNEGN